MAILKGSFFKADTIYELPAFFKADTIEKSILFACGFFFQNFMLFSTGYFVCTCFLEQVVSYCTLNANF